MHVELPASSVATLNPLESTVTLVSGTLYRDWKIEKEVIWFAFIRQKALFIEIHSFLTNALEFGKSLTAHVLADIWI